MMDAENACYMKLLKSLQQKHVSIEDLHEFRKKHGDISWINLIYNKTGDSILHISARRGLENIIKYILTSWPPSDYVDFHNNDFKTPLHEAAQFSQHKIVKLLIDYGAEIDALKRADWTPLMLACTKTGEDAYKTVEALLEVGASTYLANKDRWTPLHLACRAGDKEIVDLLLQKDGSICRKLTNNGRTVLHIACLHGNIEVVKLLLQKTKIPLDSKDDCGNTPLHDAVCSNNVDIIKMLYVRGGDITCVNNTGLSCLHMAASEGLTSAIKYLINELKIYPNVVTPSNVTPLHCAAIKKQDEAMLLLIKLGADTTIADNHGRIANDYYEL